MGCACSSDSDSEWIENLDEICEHCNCPIPPQASNPYTDQLIPYPSQNTPPMSPLADNIGVAIYSYEPKHEGDLGFEKGDKLKIINKDDPEWYLAESLTTGQKGYIPYNFIAMTTMETEPWFFKNISRNDAMRLLLAPGNTQGSFMIRESETVKEPAAASAPVLAPAPAASPTQQHTITGKRKGSSTKSNLATVLAYIQAEDALNRAQRNQHIQLLLSSARKARKEEAAMRREEMAQTAAFNQAFLLLLEELVKATTVTHV